MRKGRRNNNNGAVSKKAGALGCSIVKARTNINKNGEKIVRGSSGTVESERKTKKGYGRAKVRFEGSGKTIEVETSKLRCI